MKHLKVYYNPDADYDAKENTSANIWISINGMPCVDPIRANNELIKGKVLTARLEKERCDPVGIFSPTGAEYMIEKSDGGKKSHTYFYEDKTSIDYKTVSPEDLRKILLSRIHAMKYELRDPEIEIECFRGIPPT
jgi:hypothetical protein